MRSPIFDCGGRTYRSDRVVVAVNFSMMVRRSIAEDLDISKIPIDMGLRDGLQRGASRKRSRLYEVWMVTHKDLRHTARLRFVINYLARSFTGSDVD